MDNFSISVPFFPNEYFKFCAITMCFLFQFLLKCTEAVKDVFSAFPLFYLNFLLAGFSELPGSGGRGSEGSLHLRQTRDDPYIFFIFLYSLAFFLSVVVKH
jgi:hypothetical protein